MELNTNMGSLELEEESDSIADNSVQTNGRLRRSSRIKNKINVSLPESRKGNKKTGKAKTIEEHYLSKEVKRLPSSLETIYEEPKSLNNELQYMSSKKFKRILNCDEENSHMYKNKRSKKRLMKAKKITAAKRIISRKRISMEVLLRKLETVEEDTERSS